MKNFHDSITEAYIQQKTVELYESIILTEDRIDFLKKTYKDKIETKHDPMAQHKDSDAIIDHIASKDPSANKQYTQWMVGQYRKGNIKQEDMYRLGDNVQTFHDHKAKLDKKDINQYKHVDDLKAAVKPHEGQVVLSNKEQKEKVRQEGLDHVWGDDKIDIYHVKTQEASQSMYGGGANMGKTDWCTAAKSSDCMFNHYNEQGPMFTIHRKDDGEVFQFHPNSNQFMDRHDHEISNEDFMKIQPSFHKALDEKEHIFLADKL